MKSTSTRKTLGRTVNSVDHAVRLIEELYREQPLGVSDLARRLELPRPTIYRLLRTLGSHHLLVQEGTGYRLSLRLLELASTVLSASSLQAVVHPVLLDLVASTGETAHFAVLDGDRVGYIAKVESSHPIHMFSHVGWRGPLHATGAGKVLLAWCDPSLRASIASGPLEPFTRRTITDRERLDRELDRIRRQGYGIDQQELADGLVCVAVPVLVGNRLVGALSVAGPSERMGKTAQLADDLMRAARALTKRL